MPFALFLALPLAQDLQTGETLVTAPRALHSATETRAGVQVVTHEELAQTGERSLPRALGRAAGVWVQETNLGGGSPFLRGLTGNQILIVIDGVRLNDSTTRFGPNQNLNTIDVASVERVEVLRGPSSVLYGSDAIGGTILIWTRNRVADKQADQPGRGVVAEVEGDYLGVNDGARGSATLSDAREDYGWLVQGSLTSFDDLEAADGEVPFTGYDSNGFFGSAEWAFDEHRVLRQTVSAHRDFDVPRTDRLIPGFTAAGGMEAAATDQRHHFVLQERERFVLSYTDADPQGSFDRFQARFSYRHYREDRERQSNGSTTLRRESDEVETFGLGLDWRMPLGESQLLTFGADLDLDEVDSRRTDVDTTTGIGSAAEGTFAPDSQYDTLGVFVQDEIFLDGGWDLTTGLRWTRVAFEFDRFPSDPVQGRVDEDFDDLTAMVAVGKDLHPDLRATATLAQGFRAPNLSDLAKNGSFAGGTELANPDLDPEESLTAELAFDFRRDALTGFVALHHTWIDDIVGRQLVNEGDPAILGDETFLRQNQGEVRLYGVEAGFNTPLGGPDTPWRLNGLMAWQRGRQYDDTIDPSTGTAPFDDVPWRRVPPLYGRLGLGWNPLDPPSAGSFACDRGYLELAFADGQDELHPQDVSDRRIDPDGTPGWVVVNLDFEGPIGERREGVLGGGRWRVGLHNLFDEDYRVHGSGFDGPGRGLVLGMSWEF